MLLEFTVKNYKSFLDETTFSMKKAAKQTGLNYSLLKESTAGKNKTIVGLCSSVIYGPNAAGKTNIIGAMDVLRLLCYGVIYEMWKGKLLPTQQHLC